MYDSRYQFLEWDINPQGQEFYKDTVITEKLARKGGRRFNHSRHKDDYDDYDSFDEYDD